MDGEIHSSGISLYDLYNPSRFSSLDTNVLLVTARRNSSQDVSLSFEVDKVRFLSLSELQIALFPKSSLAQRLLRPTVKDILAMQALAAKSKVDGRPTNFVCCLEQLGNHHILILGFSIRGGLGQNPLWARPPSLGMQKERDPESWQDRFIRRKIGRASFRESV